MNIGTHCKVFREGIIVRLQKIQDFLKQWGIPFTYREDNDCGAIDFLHRGLSYHIWEYPAPNRGAESNIRTAGRMEEFEGDCQSQILEIMAAWF